MDESHIDGDYVHSPAILNDEIYCQEVDNEDLDTDSFKYADRSVTRLIQTRNKRFLVVEGGKLKFMMRTKMQCRNEDSQFKICTYMNTEIPPATPPGMPAILMVSNNGREWIICTNEVEKSVYPKLQDQPLPKHIDGSSHEALFFLQSMKERKNWYRFESSQWPGWFLAFETEEGGTTKLILKKSDCDVIDRGFQLVNCP
ncbi:hypothetical protein AGOR_G00127070 [Albula goreensis]|uniref:Interleukin-1 n=1 Tax=Albula goreensis TaxID=1534307 RepID=A0A8T3DFL1_9TELE|nr:hypothetical protein AGOR_G00127070 [Albula goreensis]